MMSELPEFSLTYGRTLMSLRSLDSARIALLRWCNQLERDDRDAPATQSLIRSLLAVALLEALNARILASKSATSALQHGIADHGLAPVPTIRARRVTELWKPVTAEQRRRLRIDGREPVAYRRVALVCGDRIFRRPITGTCRAASDRRSMRLWKRPKNRLDLWCAS